MDIFFLSKWVLAIFPKMEPFFFYKKALRQDELYRLFCWHWWSQIISKHFSAKFPRFMNRKTKIRKKSHPINSCKLYKVVINCWFHSYISQITYCITNISVGYIQYIKGEGFRQKAQLFWNLGTIFWRLKSKTSHD